MDDSTMVKDWAFIVLAAFSFAAEARALGCGDLASCRTQFRIGDGLRLRGYESLPPGKTARVVVVVHGTRRDAARTFSYTLTAARLSGALEATRILAPAFPACVDAVGEDEPCWSPEGWKVGDRSRDASRLSSFAAMDRLLGRLCRREPGAEVVLAGHSAGGQFVQRYAAGGAGCPGGRVRYIVMNPSSYLYLDPWRAAPVAGKRCRGFNDYKYGSRHLNQYMSKRGLERIRANLFSRTVHYFAGARDRRRDRFLDRRCAAMRQGPHRLARFLNYRDYADRFSAWRGSTFEIVSGIGHSARKTLAAPAVRARLFGAH